MFIAISLVAWLLVGAATGILSMRDISRIVLLPAKITIWGLATSWKFGKWAKARFDAANRKPAYGDAAWATEKQLNDGGFLTPGGFAVGALKRRTVFSDVESSVVMQARPGYGKSSTMGATLSRASGEHFVIYDPPGQLHAKFARSLGKKGYRVVVVDMDRPLSGAAYDPLSFFVKSDEYSFERDMDTLAQLLAGTNLKRMSGEGQHFTDIAEMMLGGIPAYLLEVRPLTATMSEVARLGAVNSKSEFTTLIEAMGRSSSAYVRKAANQFLKPGERERGSHETTLGRKLKEWSTRTYEDLCRKDTNTLCWDDIWDDMKPVAVFVVGGVGEPKNFGPFLRVFFGQCAASLSRHYNRNRQPLSRSVKIMVDEAALLGRCEPVVNAITELRKVGVSTLLCYQSLSQMRENFDELAHVIIDNCDLVCTGGSKNLKDYQLMSGLIGQRTLWSMQKGRGSSSSSETGQPVIRPEELRALPKGTHVALVSSLAFKGDAPWRIHRGKVVYS